MASEISLKPDDLRYEARVYMEAAEAIEAEKNKVKAQNDVMRNHWKGRAFEAYEEQFNQVAAHVVEFNALLVSIYEQLNKYADVQEARDYEDASYFGI